MHYLAIYIHLSIYPSIMNYRSMKKNGCKCIHPIWSLMKTKVYAMPMLCLWSKQWREQHLNGSIHEEIQRKTPTFDERQPLVIQHWIWISCFVDELSLQLDHGIYHHMVFSLKSRAFRDVFLEAGLNSRSAMQFKPSSNIFHDFSYDIPVIFLRSLSPVQALPLTVRDSPWVNARNGEHQAAIHDHLWKQMEPMMLRMKPSSCHSDMHCHVVPLFLPCFSWYRSYLGIASQLVRGHCIPVSK